MFERIRALVERAHALQEVAELSERELDDLGMTRSQIEAFVSMPKDVPDRVEAMAKIFGLSSEQIKQDQDAYNDLLYTCGQCPDRKACRQVLDRGALSRPHDADFCLNKRAFAGTAT